jgi:hypothetical protein
MSPATPPLLHKEIYAGADAATVAQPNAVSLPMARFRINTSDVPLQARRTRPYGTGRAATGLFLRSTKETEGLPRQRETFDIGADLSHQKHAHSAVGNSIPARVTPVQPGTSLFGTGPETAG